MAGGRGLQPRPAGPDMHPAGPTCSTSPPPHTTFSLYLTPPCAPPDVWEQLYLRLRRLAPVFTLHWQRRLSVDLFVAKWRRGLLFPVGTGGLAGERGPRTCRRRMVKSTDETAASLHATGRVFVPGRPPWSSREWWREEVVPARVTTLTSIINRITTSIGIKTIMSTSVSYRHWKYQQLQQPEFEGGLYLFLPPVEVRATFKKRQQSGSSSGVMEGRHLSLPESPGRRTRPHLAGQHCSQYSRLMQDIVQAQCILFRLKLV